MEFLMDEHLEVLSKENVNDKTFSGLSVFENNYLIMAGYLSLVELDIRLLLDRDNKLTREINGKFSQNFCTLIEILENDYKISNEEKGKLNQLREIRNQILHGNTTTAGIEIENINPDLKNKEIPALIIKLDSGESSPIDFNNKEHGLYAHLIKIIRSPKSFFQKIDYQ